MRKSFVALIYNVQFYVKWLKNAILKRHKFLNIYREKAVNGKKETGFKNGRLFRLYEKDSEIISVLEANLKQGLKSANLESLSLQYYKRLISSAQDLSGKSGKWKEGNWI